MKNCYCTRQEDSQHEVLGDINVHIVHNHYEKLEHVKPNVCVITSIGKDKSLGSSHKWTLSTYLVIYWHMMFHIKLGFMWNLIILAFNIIFPHLWMNSTSWSVRNLLFCKVSISSVESSSGSSICLLIYDLRKISSCSSTRDLSSTTLKVLPNLAYTLKS